MYRKHRLFKYGCLALWVVLVFPLLVSLGPSAKIVNASERVEISFPCWWWGEPGQWIREIATGLGPYDCAFRMEIPRVIDLRGRL